MKKRKLIIIISYTLILVLTFFYIKSVLKHERVDIYKEKKETIEETFSVNVSLNFISGTTVKTFKKEMKNNNTVQSFLKELREDGDLIYELDEYTYGPRIISVNNIIPKTGFEWAIFLGDENITTDIGNLLIQRDAVYTLKMIPQ